MDNDARRKNVLKTARSLIARDGSSFTVAALCKKNRLSRTQLRRIFPTKAALLAALDSEVIDEPPAELAELKVAHEESSRVERRLHVLQRAIALLEARIDAAGVEQTRYAASQEQAEIENTPPVTSQSPEPPGPVIMGQDTRTAHEGPEAENRGASLEPVSEAILPPVVEDPPAASPPVAPSVTREILDNARALVHTAAEKNIQLEKSEAKSNMLTLIGATVILIVGVVIGLIWVGGSARATRTSFGTASETLAKASGVTIINATGSVVVDQMTPAVRAMTARAEKGDAGAQADLAMAYLRGDDVVSNPVVAAGWAGLAATKGHPLGQFILGTLYDGGIKPDSRMAFRWMSAAALNGNVKAMHNVAVALVKGSGIERNPGEAANWFNKAASMGYRDSAFDLAVLYERGEGVAQSTQRALYWYDKAAAAGDRESAQRASLLRFGVPEIADNLDPSGRNRISRR